MVEKVEEVMGDPSDKGKDLTVAKDLLEHIYHTQEDRLPEMTILRQRLIHGLTTMQAWEKEFLEIVLQIRRYQAWWCLQKSKNSSGKYNLEKSKELYKEILDNDKVDVKELFSNVWRNSLYQHARSEEGKHLEGARQLEEGIIATQQQEQETTWGQEQ